MGKEILEFYHNRVKKEWKIAFLSTVLLGLIIHIYKFTNTLPNHDTLYNYYSNQNTIGSGRWFLSVACGFTSYFDLPWIIGIVSICLLAITTVIIVDIFKVDNPILIIIISGLLVAFPGTTETFFFEFTSDGYMLAMTLAALAVWLSRIESLNKRKSFVALCCICFSCGIYQAYISFAMVLALTYFMLVLLENKYNTKDIRRWVISQISIFGIGVVLYYAIWKVMILLQGAKINAYQGIDEISFSLQTIIGAFPNTIKTIVLLLLGWNPLEHGFTLYAILNIIFIFLAIVAFICAITKTDLRKKKDNFILFALCGIAIPFAACIWLFTSSGVNYRPMMLHSLCIVYIFVAILYEKYCSVKWKNLCAILLVFIVSNNAIVTNIAYYYMQRSYYATFATASEINARIHELDTEIKKIAVIGELSEEVSLHNEKHSKSLHMLGQMLEANFMFDEVHTINFLNETFYCDYVGVGSSWAIEKETQKEIEKMNCWPASNSIKIIEDTIVIRLK